MDKVSKNETGVRNGGKPDNQSPAEEQKKPEENPENAENSADANKEAAGQSPVDLSSENETAPEIDCLRSELEAIKDLLMRRQADFENYKKRNIRLQDEFKKNMLKDFAYEVILVNDDLLRAIGSSGNVSEYNAENFTTFVNGVEMISKRFEELLKKYGIEEIEALGTAFNPNFHEAVEIENSHDVSQDTVTYVHQKGFKLDDLVIRSAKVKVSKPMQAESN